MRSLPIPDSRTDTVVVIANDKMGEGGRGSYWKDAFEGIYVLP